MASSGTLKQLNIDGTKIPVHGDVDVTQMGGTFTNDSIATSAGNFKKKIKNTSAVTGFSGYIDDQLHEILSELNDRIENFPISFTTADNNTFRATGFINYENRTSADNKASITLFPESRDGFVLFQGS